MRVILDTNIFISYLLARDPNQVIMQVVERCLSTDEIELVVPPESINEMQQAVQRKPYLRRYIAAEDLADLAEALRSVAFIPEPLNDFLQLARDPDDDYLLAYALVERIDFLVTGDDDLLVLDQVEEVQIISAGRLLELLG